VLWHVTLRMLTVDCENVLTAWLGLEVLGVLDDVGCEWVARVGRPRKKTCCCRLSRTRNVEEEGCRRLRVDLVSVRVPVAAGCWIRVPRNLDEAEVC
jgi:hypothetical protein